MSRTSHLKCKSTVKTSFRRTYNESCVFEDFAPNDFTLNLAE